jgi:transposase InsO family protein
VGVTSPSIHPGGKLYCCAVLDAFSRKIVGWSTDSTQNATPVVNALDMAIGNRNPRPGTVFTPIMAFNSRPAPSPTGSSKQASYLHSAPLETLRQRDDGIILVKIQTELRNQRK